MTERVKIKTSLNFARIFFLTVFCLSFFVVDSASAAPSCVSIGAGSTKCTFTSSESWTLPDGMTSMFAIINGAGANGGSQGGLEDPDYCYDDYQNGYVDSCNYWCDPVIAPVAGGNSSVVNGVRSAVANGGLASGGAGGFSSANVTVTSSNVSGGAIGSSYSGSGDLTTGCGVNAAYAVNGGTGGHVEAVFPSPSGTYQISVGTGANNGNVVIYYGTDPFFSVTSSAGTNGTISISGINAVMSGLPLTYTVTPSAGYVANMSGTCGGTLSGNTYTTAAITGDCTVIANFTLNSGLYDSAIRNLPNSAFGKITWTGSFPAGTSLKMRIRSLTANNVSNARKSFSDLCNVAATNTDISSNPCVSDGDPYLQYEAILSTDSGINQPYLSNVTISTEAAYSTNFASNYVLSSPFNTSPTNNNFFSKVTSVNWSNIGDNGATSAIGFQFRSAADTTALQGAQWCGPVSCGPVLGNDSGDNSNFYTTKGQLLSISQGPGAQDAINSVKNKFFQYATFLRSTDNGATTPTLQDVTVGYSFNVPPEIVNQNDGSDPAYVQNSNGSLSVKYRLKETFDGLGQNLHGVNAGSAIKTGLFYQPDNGVTLNGALAANFVSGLISINNSSNLPIPAAGTMLIGNELMTFDSVGVTGNQRNITARGAYLGTSTYPTTVVGHSSGDAIYFLATRKIDGTNLVQSIEDLAASGTAGQKTQTDREFLWDAKNEVGFGFDTKKLLAANFLVVANDGDSSTFNTIGKSALISSKEIDYEKPSIMSIINGASITKDTYYKFNSTVAIDVTFSENISASAVTLVLSNGKTATCSDVLAAANQNVLHCSYVVGSGLDSNTNPAALGVTSFGNGSVVVDKFSNAADFTIAAGKNLSDQAYKTIIDTQSPFVTTTAPISDGYINVGQVKFALNEIMQNSSIVFTSTTAKNGETSGGVHAYNLAGAELTNLSQQTKVVSGLIDGNVYTVSITGKDLAGNDMTVNSVSNVTFDTTNPAASITSPDNGVAFNNISTASDVSYNLSEDLQTGSFLRFTRTSGTIDGSSPRTCNLTGTELIKGDHNNVNLSAKCGGFDLVDGGIYSIDFHAIDLAGNVGDATAKNNVIYDTTAPILTNLTSDKADIIDPNNAYGVGEHINIQAIFNEPLVSGATMTVKLNNTAQRQVVLNQISGSMLSGEYVVNAPSGGLSDDATDLGVTQISSINVADAAGNVKSSENVPIGENLSDNKNIMIDTVPPSTSSFSATSGNFKQGDIITITANYNKSVKSSSNIHVKINADQDVQTIDLTNVQGANISGTYLVKTGDNTQNLKVDSIVSQNVLDAKNNILNDTTLPVNNILDGTQVDTTLPVVSFTNDVNPDPNQIDTVTLHVTETNLASAEYVFAADNNCSNKTYSSSQAFATDTPLQFSTEVNNDKYFCAKVADQAGNVTYLASASKFNIDAVSPTAQITVDRSKQTGQINLLASDKDRSNVGMQMQIQEIENSNAACDFSSATWISYAQYSDLASSADFVKVCAKLKDQAGNVLDEISTVTPNNPKNFVYTDLTSPTFTGAILKWDEPLEEGSGNFKQYNLLRCTGIGCTPIQNQTIEAKNQNYYVYNNLVLGTTYCYQLTSQDNNNDISKLSDKICYAPGDGPISANTKTAFKEDPYVGNITKTGANVIFKTVNANDNNSPLATVAEIKVYDDQDLTNLVKTVIDPLAVTHVVNVAGLTQSKTYYLQISATDTSIESNPTRTVTLSYDKNIDLEKYSFSTIGILKTIDNIKEDIITDTKASIIFTTNQDAKCFIDFKDSLIANYNDLSDNLEKAFNTNHTITLTQLLPKTNYDYKVTCTDEGSTVVTSDEHHFVTAEKGLTQSEADANSDTAAPSISGIVLSNVTSESATVTWNTDEKANSSLTYEANGSTFSMMAGDSSVNADKNKFTTSHSVIITGIIPATKYLFTVLSYDLAGNIGQSSQSNFTTKAPSDLSSIKVVSTALGQATVTWSTSNATTSTVEYGLTTAYGQSKQDSANVKEHSINLADLTPGSTYHFRVMGEDSDKNIFASSDITFQPKAPPKISGFNINSITEHGATISFITSVPTDALITFTDNANQENSGVQGNPVITAKHEIKLKELASGETFGINIKVGDEDGNESEETFEGFTTTKDENPPKIDMVKTDTALTQNDKVQAIISWTTDEIASGKIIYKEGKAGDEKTFNVNDQASFSHVGVITSFKPGTVYYFKVKSADIVGNDATSTDFAVLTPKKRQNIIQIIIGNFTEIFGWAKF